MNDDDIYDRIEQRRYEPNLEFPARPAKPLLRREHNSKHIEEYLKSFIIYESQRSQYNSEVDAYRKNRNECHGIFKKDALEYWGITDHPKAERAFTMASEDSPNFQETLVNLAELADLLKD